VVLTILKNISQWEGLSHILWNIKNDANHQSVINLEFVNPLLSKLTLAGYEVNVGKPWQTYRLNHGQSLRSLDAQNPAKLGCPSYKLVYVGL